jgi:hypothetical protein
LALKDLLPHLAVLVGVGLLVALIFWLVHRHQAAQLRAVQELAAQRGWKLEPFREPLAWGERLSAGTWMLEAASRSHGREHGPGSSDVSMTTRWRAPMTGSRLIIGRRPAGAALGDLGAGLARRALELLLGEQIAGLQEVQSGSEALRARYMLWAEPGAGLEELLTPAVEAALLGWEGPDPVIRRRAGALEIELAGAHLKKPTELSALVALGEALLSSARPSRLD